MTPDPVLQYAGLAKDAERETGVPAAVLLGLTNVESGGNIHAVSPAGAFGLTQFMPGTAVTYHVTRDDPRSQFLGAGRYLRDLGFARDPRTALAKYNGGPGNPQYGYADEVLSRSKRYGDVKVPNTTSPPTKPAAPTPSSSGGDVLGGFGDQALHALLWAALALAGATLIGLGTARATGLRQPHGAVA